MARVTIDREEGENVEDLEWKSLPKQKKSQTGKRRLLITTDNFLPRWDGISRFLSEIIPRLQRTYDITVVAPDYGHVSMDGVEVVKIPLRKSSYGDYRPAKLAYRKIMRLVRRSDVVFNQALGPIGLCAIIAAKRVRRPIASYIHSVEWELLPRAAAFIGPLRGVLYPMSKSAVAFFYNRCTVLIFPSEHIAELFSWQRVKTQKRVAHLGVDTTKFTVGDRKKAREGLNLPADAFIVGYHGRIGYEKNLMTLLRAFRRLRVKDKRLIIVGDGVARIKAKLSRYDDVVLAGSTNHVLPWLQAMDVYVQPSFTETTSLTVLEAMASGLPVISSKVGFINHYIVDGQNGLFFNNNSPFDLFRKIMRLHDDKVLRSTLAINARRTVVEQFNWEKTAQAISEILDHL